VWRTLIIVLWSIRNPRHRSWNEGQQSSALRPTLTMPGRRITAAIVRRLLRHRRPLPFPTANLQAGIRIALEPGVLCWFEFLFAQPLCYDLVRLITGEEPPLRRKETLRMTLRSSDLAGLREGIATP
jgi:hypothetical protein